MSENRRFFSLIFLCLYIIVFFSKVALSAWNFSAVGLSDDVPIWKFAFWRNRAFFALPSFTRSDKGLNSNLTLLEACWPEPDDNPNEIIANNVGNDVRIFSKSLNGGEEKCGKFTSVVGLDLETRGRLWILDSSEDTDCPAKIVIYDLRRNDLEVVRTDLKGIPKSNLKTLVIDPFVGILGPRAYIGDPGDQSIIIYSLYKKRWWKLKLVNENSIPSFNPVDIAVSRKNSLLYVTDPRSQDLFSIDLDNSRYDEGLQAFQQNKTIRNATIRWLGEKMGSSSGLVIDQKGGLHYFLVTEHASVCWDTKHNLKASSYAVLLQSAEVPCITDYKLDGQRTIWGLVNLANPLFKNSKSNYLGKWNGKFRTVRIFKPFLS